jgi:thioredoxin reductase
MKKLVVIGSGIAGLIAAVEGSKTHGVVLVLSLIHI